MMRSPSDSLSRRVVGLCRMRPDLNPQQLANATGAPLSTVYQARSRAGLSDNPKAKVEKALALMRETPGLTARQLADASGLSTNSVHRVAQRAGYTLGADRRGRPPKAMRPAVVLPPLAPPATLPREAEPEPVRDCPHRVCPECEGLLCWPGCRTKANPRDGYSQPTYAPERPPQRMRRAAAVHGEEPK